MNAARTREALEEALAWFDLNRQRLAPPADKSDIALRLLRAALAERGPGPPGGAP